MFSLNRKCYRYQILLIGGEIKVIDFHLEGEGKNFGTKQFTKLDNQAKKAIGKLLTRLTQ